MTKYAKYDKDGNPIAVAQSKTAHYSGFTEVGSTEYEAAKMATQSSPSTYSLSDWASDREADAFSSDSEALDKLAEALQ